MRIALLLSVLCCGIAVAAATTPTFQARIDFYPSSGQPQVTDINGDGTPDIILVESFYVYTLLGNGDGTFQVSPTTGPSFCAEGFVAIDLNGDGYPDLVL
jgi:VCBS repeat protein